MENDGSIVSAANAFITERRCWADESEALSPEFAPIRVPADQQLSKRHNTLQEDEEFDLDSLWPPYNLFVGDLSFDIDKRALGNFFADRGCSVSHVRLPREDPKKGKGGNRCKGFGYVEFDNAESLQMALRLNGVLLQGRKIKVDIADRDSKPGKAAKKGDHGDSSWASRDREGKGRKSGGKSNAQQVWQRTEDWTAGADTTSSDYQGWDDRGRFRVKMKDVAVPETRERGERVAGHAEVISPSPAPAVPSEPRKKIDPFGGAKPRDEAEYEKRKLEEGSSKLSVDVSVEEPREKPPEHKEEEEYHEDWNEWEWGDWAGGGWNPRPRRSKGGKKGRGKRKSVGKGGNADRDVNWRD